MQAVEDPAVQAVGVVDAGQHAAAGRVQIPGGVLLIGQPDAGGGEHCRVAPAVVVKIGLVDQLDAGDRLAFDVVDRPGQGFRRDGPGRGGVVVEALAVPGAAHFQVAAAGEARPLGLPCIGDVGQLAAQQFHAV